MGGHYIAALRISPRYTSQDWYDLNRYDPDDWKIAAKIVKDRLDGRFLRYASNCLRSPHSGFVILAIDSLMLETLQQFRDGITDGNNKSRRMVTRFLEGKRFQPHFDLEAREAYYSDIRCGLLHQAEAKRLWLVRRNQGAMLSRSQQGEGYVLDVRLFHKALRQSMNDYLRELQNPASVDLRAKLWTKMDQICCVRKARGAVFEADAE